MPNDIEDIYGSKRGVDFAQEMAKVLLKPGMSKISGDMAYVPGAWMQSVPDILQALSGSQYRDVGLSQAKEQTERTINPNFKSGVQGYGQWARQPRRQDISAGPNAQPIETGSIPGITDGKVTYGKPEIPPFQTTTTPYLDKIAKIESGGNPGAQRPGSQYRGLYQFSPELEKKYGINNENWKNIDIQREAAEKHTSSNYDQLVQMLGRQPTDGELYLAHQQGVGGAAAHLLRPEFPAWQNMHSTAEGQKKGTEWSKKTIRDNIPNGHPLKYKPIEQVTSGEFADLWKNKVGEQNTFAQNTETRGPTGEMMRLGGPMEGQQNAGAPQEQPLPQQMAQMAGQAPPYTATPAPPGQASPATNSVPGYQGSLPPANPLESTEQLRARLLNSDPADQNKILEDYMKRAGGRSVETEGGNLHITPGAGGAPPNYAFTPGQNIPIHIEGVGTLQSRQTVDPKTKQLKTQLLTPDGKGLQSLQDIIDFGREQKAATVEATSRAGKTAERYEDMYTNINNNYKNVADRGHQLEIASKLIEDPAFISGTGQERRERMQKFLDTIGATPPGKGADITQVFTKIVSGLILEDIKGLGGQGLGQVRAKEMEIIEKMNAMPDLSHGAIRALTRMATKANHRVQEYNDMALDYAEEHGGKLDAKFDQKMKRHWRANPYLTDDEIENYKKELFVPNKPAKQEQPILKGGWKREKVE